MQLESQDPTSSIGTLVEAVMREMHQLTSISCQVDPKYLPFNPLDLKLVTIDICTQTNNYILQDGFKSFPSGHSSGMLEWLLSRVLS
jgi:membrane-associated phospholipid phosphatase